MLHEYTALCRVQDMNNEKEGQGLGGQGIEASNKIQQWSDRLNIIYFNILTIKLDDKF